MSYKLDIVQNFRIMQKQELVRIHSHECYCESDNMDDLNGSRYMISLLPTRDERKCSLENDATVDLSIYPQIVR